MAGFLFLLQSRDASAELGGTCHEAEPADLVDLIVLIILLKIAGWKTSSVHQVDGSIMIHTRMWRGEARSVAWSLGCMYLNNV